MKSFVMVLIFSFLITVFTPIVFADARDTFERARMDYANAAVCLATYSDRAGQIARYALAQQGWQIIPRKEKEDGVETKVFIAKNETYIDGREIYIVAVTGTETVKDVLLDLNFHKVYFGGQTPEGFIEKAGKKNVKSTDPMVHSGFNQYANKAFYGAVDGEEPYGVYLTDLLKADARRKVYLTGHSLGGAVSTIEAARLISSGVLEEQVEVVTFGAPAVGNKAFTDLFNNKLQLRRIVLKGDVVKEILQGISSEYKQFGDEVVWKDDKNLVRDKHDMALYLDTATRNFYDAKLAAQAEGLPEAQFVSRRDGANMVYISPLQTRLNQDIAADETYIRLIVQDVLRSGLEGFVFGGGERGSLQEELDKARAAGCDWLLWPEVTAEKVKDKKNVYYLTTQERLYRVSTGNLAALLQAASGSQDLTPLEVAGHNTLKLNGERNALLHE